MLMPKFILIFLIGNVVDISSGKFVSSPESWKLKFDEGRQKEVEQSREASLDAGCPEGHVEFKHHCYLPSFKDGKDFTSPLNWTDAQDFCTKLNIPDMIYNLVSLQDKNEYDFVLSYDWSELYKTYKETFAIWIGLNDIDEEDDWRWSDNSPLKYPIASNLPWIKNEPNNHNDNEDCVRTKGLLGLNDVDCKIKGPFLCEGYFEDEDKCLHIPCGDHGKCEKLENPNGYICSCEQGWMGDDCDMEVVDGHWSMWKYTTCSSSCQGGTRRRTRACNNPIPQNGGKQCSGVEEEEIDCNKEAKCTPDNKCSGTVTSDIYEETCDPNHVLGGHAICRYDIGDKSSSRTEGFNSCPTTYEKRPGQHCGLHGYKNYQNLEDALKACSQDEGCTGVDDKKCKEDTEKEFRLCTKDPYFRMNNDEEERPPFWMTGVCRYLKKFTTCDDTTYNFDDGYKWSRGEHLLNETMSESDESKLMDYSYPWATFSDSPTKIKINMEGDHKNCTTSQDVDNTTMEMTTNKVAEAIGRIPGYVRGVMTRFSITSGCGGDELWLASGTASTTDLKWVIAGFESGSFEETLLHELTHMNAVGYNYLDTDFQCALNLDAKGVKGVPRKTLTWYGHHNRGEEEAESFQFWFALKTVHGRITEKLKDEILAVAPNRMALFDAVMSP